MAPPFCANGDVLRTAGKPLLTAVSDSHLCAWRKFAPRAMLLAAEKAASQNW